MYSVKADNPASSNAAGRMRFIGVAPIPDPAENVGSPLAPVLRGEGSGVRGEALDPSPLGYKGRGETEADNLYRAMNEGKKITVSSACRTAP